MMDRSEVPFELPDGLTSGSRRRSRSCDAEVGAGGCYRTDVAEARPGLRCSGA
jgi:hypothetical protein